MVTKTYVANTLPAVQWNVVVQHEKFQKLLSHLLLMDNREVIYPVGIVNSVFGHFNTYLHHKNCSVWQYSVVVVAQSCSQALHSTEDVETGQFFSGTFQVIVVVFSYSNSNQNLFFPNFDK